MDLSVYLYVCEEDHLHVQAIRDGHVAGEVIDFILDSGTAAIFKAVQGDGSYDCPLLKALGSTENRGNPELNPWQRLREDGFEEVLDTEDLEWITGDQLDFADVEDEGPDKQVKAHEDQPRVPAGQPEGGQFTSGGSGTATATERRQQRDHERRTAAHSAREAEIKERLEKPARVDGTASHDEQSRLDDLFPEGGFRREQLADVVGAPRGSVVSTSIPVWGGGLQLRVDHPYFKDCSRTLNQDRNGNLVMHNNKFFLEKAQRGSGLGLDVFSGEVRTCANLGVDRIETCAGKGGIMNGYYTWPVLGYDAALDKSVRGFGPGMAKQMERELQSSYMRFDGKKRAALSEEEASKAATELRDARTVQDLMAHPAGREYWLRHGYMSSMTFDCKPGSRSLSVLNDYLKSKGKPGVEVDVDKVTAIKANRIHAATAEGKREQRERQEKEEDIRLGQRADPHWTVIANHAGFESQTIQERAGKWEANYLNAVRANPSNYGIPESNRGAIRYASYRAVLEDAISERHYERMTSHESAYGDTRRHMEGIAEQQGLDPMTVRALAHQTPMPDADGVHALASAYRYATRELLRQHTLRAESA